MYLALISESLSQSICVLIPHVLIIDILFYVLILVVLVPSHSFSFLVFSWISLLVYFSKLSSSPKKIISIFIRIVLNLEVNSRRTYNFMMFSYPVQEHQISFHLFSLLFSYVFIYLVNINMNLLNNGNYVLEIQKLKQTEKTVPALLFTNVHV